MWLRALWSRAELWFPVACETCREEWPSTPQSDLPVSLCDSDYYLSSGPVSDAPLDLTPPAAWKPGCRSARKRGRVWAKPAVCTSPGSGVGALQVSAAFG